MAHIQKITHCQPPSSSLLSCFPLKSANSACLLVHFHWIHFISLLFVFCFFSSLLFCSALSIMHGYFIDNLGSIMIANSAAVRTPVSKGF